MIIRKKTSMRIAAGVVTLFTVILIVVALGFHLMGISFIRFCLGESVATQWVNDTADQIIALKLGPEIKRLSDQLELEFFPLNSSLQKDPFSEGYLIPVEKLPLRYQRLGGQQERSSRYLDLIMKIGEQGQPVELDISWFHMRKSIIIYSAPPTNPPKGFFVRKVDECIYVVAGYE